MAAAAQSTVRGVACVLSLHGCTPSLPPEAATAARRSLFCTCVAVVDGKHFTPQCVMCWGRAI